MKKLIAIFFFLFMSLASWAYHIVGGEIIYDYIGNDQYRIILKIYRDCQPTTTTPFDGMGIAGPAYVTVYDANLKLVGVFDVGSPTVTPVPPAFNNPCIQAPSGTCVEEGLYMDTLTLPPLPGGYTLVYQRCCRNAGVVNLVNSVGEGSSYITKIPGPPDAVNSSPRYTNFPPLYICNKVNFKFDHSATDPDGDQLVYSLCPPYTGLDPCCPALNSGISLDPNCVSPPAMCPSQGSAPPYTNVLFASPYSGTYPIASSPAFSIDPATGMLSGTPNLIGLYVVGVCVQEFRNNVLINTHFRDFQFTVVGCTVSVQSLVADQQEKCQGNNIKFTNQSINNSPSPTYHWDFGVQSLASDTSNIVHPSYMYPDTGIYTITLITNPGKPCSDTLQKQVFVYPPLAISFDQPRPQCLKGNSFSFSTKGIYLPQTTYLWDFTPFATPSGSTLKDPTGIQFSQSGLFLVKLSAAQFACRDSFIDSVNVIGRPKAQIGILQNNLCDPARITFSNSSTSDLPLRYTWLFSNGQTSNAFAPTVVFTPAGNYMATLIVETTQLCLDTSMAVIANIQVNPKPLAAFTFTPRETSIFEPEIMIKSASPDSPLNMMFDSGDGQNFSTTQLWHTYANYGDYKITQTVMNIYGCTDTTSDVVRILPEFCFWVPNTFTPDDSQRNDVFFPVMIGTSEYEFEVYDRWGEKLFATNEIGQGWNGNYKGKACKQDVYIWKISFRNVVTQKQEAHQGHVTLIRSPV